MSISSTYIERDLTEDEKEHAARVERVRGAIKKMGKERLLKIAEVVWKYLVEEPPAQISKDLSDEAFAILHDMRQQSRPEIVRRLNYLFAIGFDVALKRMVQVHNQEMCRLNELRNVWIFG